MIYIACIQVFKLYGFPSGEIHFSGVRICCKPAPELRALFRVFSFRIYLQDFRELFMLAFPTYTFLYLFL